MVTRTTPSDLVTAGDTRQTATRALPWERLGLAGVLLIAAVANGFRLTQEGYANTYYAAAVQNMLRGWRDFFFVGFDDFVSVDKPPLGFWLQAASAKLFGFHPWSLLLPEAVAGVLAVALVYLLVRRPFGVVAGLLAALVLAVSPVSIAVNRNNTIDALLVCTVLAAAWCVSRAAERGALRWLIAGFVLVGLGFNIKMLEAYLVLPALVLLYFVSRAAGRWPVRIAHLGIATFILLAVSFSWATIVELTPANARPYVGSTQNNSVYDLIFGYNGLQRLLGPTFGNRAAGDRAAQTPTDVQSPTGNAVPAGGQAAGSNGQLSPSGQLPLFPGGGLGPGGAVGTGGVGNSANFGPGGTFETGYPGVLRLLNTQLAGQIGWLLPLAVIGLAVAAWQVNARRVVDAEWDGETTGRFARVRRWFARPVTVQGQSLVLWGVWFVTVAGFFSVAKEFHRYYLSMLAPAVAALVGIGVVTLWAMYRRGGLLGWLLPLALVGTAAVQVFILRVSPQWSARLTPVIVGVCAIGAVVLVVARLRPLVAARPLASIAVTAAMLALLIAPAMWAAIPIAAGRSFGQLPVAGPATNAGPFGGGLPAGNGMSAGGAMPGGFGEANPTLVAYLTAHQGNATYVVAGPNANTVAPIALAAGKPAMALGGFIGQDPVFTVDQIASVVGAGTVRYFLLMQFPGDIAGASGGGPAGFPGASSTATSWVTNHCTALPSSQWQGNTAITGATGGLDFARFQSLYDCGANVNVNAKTGA